MPVSGKSYLCLPCMAAFSAVVVRIADARARAGRQPAEDRIATRRTELAAEAK